MLEQRRTSLKQMFALLLLVIAANVGTAQNTSDGKSQTLMNDFHYGINFYSSPIPIPDDFVETIPASAVEPLYDHELPFCPRTDFVLQWFVQKRPIEDTVEAFECYGTGGECHRIPPRHKDVLFFDPMCVPHVTPSDEGSGDNKYLIPLNTVQLIPLSGTGVYTGTPIQLQGTPIQLQ
jgi:hypothetical protein